MLDNVNKRVLFFDQSGKVDATLRLDEMQEPIDFIVNNAGETFVYGGDGGPNFQVLRYGPDGKVTLRLPVSPGVNADGIMLTAAQDLMLVQGNQTFWTLLHQGSLSTRNPAADCAGRFRDAAQPDDLPHYPWRERHARPARDWP